MVEEFHEKKLHDGLLVVFEGIDGSGKTTLAQKLYDMLSQHTIPAIVTKEPGSTEFGKVIRSIVQTSRYQLTSMSEYLLFASDRADHIVHVIKPALAAGKVVVCDRMSDSSVSYQGYGRGLDIDKIVTINDWTLQGIRPDLTFYLEIDYITAQQRLKQRAGELSSFDQAKEGFFTKVIQGYETLYQNRLDVVRLDARQSVEESCQKAYEIVHKMLK